MDQYIHEVCAEYWKGVIKACEQRPAGIRETFHNIRIKFYMGYNETVEKVMIV